MKNSCRLSLYVVITSHHKSKDVIYYAHEFGLKGMTVLMGRGTMTKGILGYLGLTDSERDIILLAADTTIGDQAIEKIAKEMEFHKPRKGIVISIPLGEIIGSNTYCSREDYLEEAYTVEHQAIYCIVEKGRAEDVIDSALQAGASGGTIFNARGSGVHEQEMLFNIPIEPEKEMVMMIAKTEKVHSIITQIRKDLALDEPGNGILFVLDVRKAIGLYGE